jgi:2-desacetyl-2-hydroxyethyl bacteriochlorophyllide A dehydrogenase
MRAFEVQSIKNGGVVEMPEPPISPNDILVRVAYCGVCGTDLHIFEGELSVRLPLVPGHEFSGVVDRVGQRVKRIRLGDHVAVDPNINCGVCYYCKKGMTNFCEKWEAIGVTRQGAYAELVAAPASNVYRVPESTPLERFAFVEPVSCVLHGLDRANPKKGETALVIGLGTIGLIFGQLLKTRGIKVIGADLVKHRLKLAESLGFDQTVNPAEESTTDVIKSWTGGRGVDLVVEASGSTKATEEAIELVDKTGRIIVFGVAPETATLTVRPFALYRNEISLIGSFTNPNTFARAIKALSSGRLSVEELISKTVDLGNIEATLGEVSLRKGIKYLVKPK